MIKLGVLTVSDRASAGEYADRSGPAAADYLRSRLVDDWTLLQQIVPDERSVIESTIRELVAEECCLIVATGGTGPAPRDVTPEAVESVCDRLIPGFGERMRSAAPPSVPTAFLSRQLAGSLGSCLVVAIPGNPRAIAECLDAVFAGIPHCIELLGGPRLVVHDPVDPGH